MSSFCLKSLIFAVKPSINPSGEVNKLRLVSIFCTCATITLVVAWTGLLPTLATEVEQQDKIAWQMQSLQQSQQKWIEIDLLKQRLIAWEGKTPVYAIIISTGKDSTPTRTGTFAIQSKYRLARMQGPDYDVPDVPYTMYYDGGNAIHGAYWHNNFGIPVSHGCTNVAVNHAKWLFNWAPIGTPVIVHE